MSVASDIVMNEPENGEKSRFSTRSAKKKRQKRKQRVSSDEDESDVDDVRLKEEMKDFVVDEGEEEQDDNMEEGNSTDEKSNEAGSDEDDLCDDDLDLLDENCGRKFGGRVEISDDDEDGDDRERIKNDIFGHDSRYNSHQLDSHRKKGMNDDDEEEEGQGPHNEARDVFGIENIASYDDDDDEAVEDESEEGEETISKMQKNTKVPLWNTLEPSELDKGYVNAADKRIVFEDRPERFQMRKIPVTEIEENDLDLEMTWVHEYAFRAETLSKQQNTGLSMLAGQGMAAFSKAEMEAPEKIKEALRFIRNQHFEVPFIAFYRKEYVESSLQMSDLWKVYQYDEKYCRLQLRKNKVLDLLKRMQQYVVNSDGANNLRKISEKDFDNVTGVQTSEELSDVYAHFQLYYGNEMSRVHEWEQIIAKERLDSTFVPKFKLCGRTDKYLLCMQCGLGPMAEQFGLTPEEFSENFTEYVKHEVRQNPVEPMEVAKGYITENFPTVEDVLKGAIYVLAQRFSREPAVRKKLREMFRGRLKFSVYPTEKGKTDIDQSHPLWNRHYIKDKPVSSIEDDEYLLYIRAKNDGLVELKFFADTAQENNSLVDCLFKEPVFHREDFAYVVAEWNNLREDILKVCVKEFLLPVFEREAHERLMEEARDCVLRKCSAKLLSMLSTEFYKPTFRYDNEEMDDGSVRVMSVCYSSEREEASFALVVDQDGMVVEYKRLVHFTKRANSRFPDEKNLKTADLKTLKEFILSRQPHVIGINGDNLDALRIAEDVKRLVKQMRDENDIPAEIPVEITDNDAAKVYMNSRSALQEFPNYPPLLRQAVSLARFVLDPLIEICHLCNNEDDILFMKFSSLQSDVPKPDLLFALQLECINRVNEVGVDINRCLEFPHTSGLLQFVCGLGPRKASHLLKMLKQNENLLESRAQLCTLCKMGPKIFLNSSGFIKINTAKVAEHTEDYVEVLDGSRVHPDTYAWTRKMAVDAIDNDEPNESNDPSGALEEVIQCTDYLKTLDLDAFAEELERQGFGNKNITLRDIYAELQCFYKDMRIPHKALGGSDLLDVLMKDKGHLINGRVLSIVYGRPGPNATQNAREPILNGANNKWLCGDCYLDFNDKKLCEEHKQSQTCQGILLGVKVRLENGMPGYALAKNTSDKADADKTIRQRLFPGQNQIFCVIGWNPRRVELEISCRSSDLQKSISQPARDAYFDSARFEEDRKEHRSKISAKRCGYGIVKNVV